MPASRKRIRAGAPASLLALPSVADFRATLGHFAEADALPASWGAAAASAGVSGADDFLCHLGRSIAEALQSIPAKAEAARARLRSTRAALLSAVNSRCDELEARITEAESSKIAALERELCAVDAALERLRAERSTAAEAALSLNDAELDAQHAVLSTSLDSAEAQLHALPTALRELPCLQLLVDDAALLASITAFGYVVAPQAINAADLTLKNFPHHIRLGQDLRLYFVLQSTRHASQSAEELEVSLPVAAAATHVEAILEAEGAAPLPLRARIGDDSLKRCIVVSVSVPLSAPVDAFVRIGPITLFGKCIPGTVEPLRIPVLGGIQAPGRIQWMEWEDPVSMCISRAGQLFVPVSETPEVHVFDSDGAPLPLLPVAELGLSNETCWAAITSGVSPTLLLADHCGARGSSSRLVAVETASRAVRWATAPGVISGCNGLAVLPDHGVVIAACFWGYYICVHRLSDGVRVGYLDADGAPRFLAADPATGAVFGTCIVEDDCIEIDRFSWAPEAGLRAEGVVASVGLRTRNRPLAIVPPAPGKRVSHLVVAEQDADRELFVLSLPDLALVHTHALKGMEVMALAADPLGEALAVYDVASRAIHVLAWPLPGMPELE